MQPIVYPTVPKALPRLRTIVNLSHCADDLDYAVGVFRVGRSVGLIAVERPRVPTETHPCCRPPDRAAGGGTPSRGERSE